MDLSFLNEIVLILAMSVGVMFACHKIGLPPVVGFLVAGVLCGPGGFALVKNVHQVEMIAEMGVVLLLFSIGMELSASELVRLKRPVFLGGLVQIGLTIALFEALSVAGGFESSQGLFFGFLAALSSTAIVLKELQRRAELESPHGRMSLAILIFQDLAIVPLMLLTPFLGGKGGDLASSLGIMALKGVGVVGVVLVLARYVVPRFFLSVAKVRSRELFLMATIVFCLSVALLTASVGLSLSLGAFLAGLMLSESEYALNALEGVLPFKDIFTSLFFVSVGMLVDVGFIAHNPGLVLGAALAVIVLKALAAGGAVMALGYPLRTAVAGGLVLAQVGEFSFVLAKVGMDTGLLEGDTYQLFLASSVITMAVTPWLIQLGPVLAARLGGAAPANAQAPNEKTALKDHLIIVGFGPGGQRIAHAAKRAGIAYYVLEMNIDTVRREREKGEPIHYGDASYPEVLRHAGILGARVMVVVISDPSAARRMVSAARELSPALRIVVRTRFMGEVEELLALGANDVVPEEFETSIEIFTRVLVDYLVPNQTIERFILEARGANYRMLRTPALPQDGQKLMTPQLSGMDLAVLTVEQGSRLDGNTLQESHLRREHGLTVVAVDRDGAMTLNPEGSYRFQAGDKAYVFSRQEDIVDKAWLFSAA
ncbi:Inner membrane protein YbaL [Fundidesulfovibrio magnetotacticus]|uniref:Inner membrane protein YbaL n=1 Tax=Fundidesulfovibrio magnetotacticus TaxID=2730080 RepID=A0A6V8LQM7_9BACT|nr:monovalent cation:proton antiporter family protein [Fundidesulfovibrio magnetotacticus]GFK92638.1 Inner membrane protein YbaL [Fundidesulfovibrio magnetotacticus]